MWGNIYTYRDACTSSNHITQSANGSYVYSLGKYGVCEYWTNTSDTVSSMGHANSAANWKCRCQCWYWMLPFRAHFNIDETLSKKGESWVTATWKFWLLLLLSFSGLLLYFDPSHVRPTRHTQIFQLVKILFIRADILIQSHVSSDNNQNICIWSTFKLNVTLSIEHDIFEYEPKTPLQNCNIWRILIFFLIYWLGFKVFFFVFLESIVEFWCKSTWKYVHAHSLTLSFKIYSILHTNTAMYRQNFVKL